MEVNPTRFLLGFCLIWSRIIDAPGKSMATRRRFPRKKSEISCYASAISSRTVLYFVLFCNYYLCSLSFTVYYIILVGMFAALGPIRPSMQMSRQGSSVAKQ